jgi:hypothetical protein
MVSPANKLTQEVIKILNDRGNKVHRINNTPVQRRKGTTTKGVPDVEGIGKKGLYVGVEIKTTDKQSKDQEIFEAEIKSRGGIYFIVHNLEELYNFINVHYHNI